MLIQIVGVNPNLMNIRGQTLLHVVCEKGVLVGKGGRDPFSIFNSKLTHDSSFSSFPTLSEGHLSCIQTLLRFLPQGLRINQQSSVDGATPLHTSALLSFTPTANSPIDCSVLLLQAGRLSQLNSNYFYLFLSQSIHQLTLLDLPSVTPSLFSLY